MADYGRIADQVVEAAASAATNAGRVADVVVEAAAASATNKGRVAAVWVEVFAAAPEVIQRVGQVEIWLRTLTTLSRDLGSGLIPEVIHYMREQVLADAYGDTNTVTAGAPVSYDLAGSLTAIEGTTIHSTSICMIAVRNKSTTPGAYLTVGAGSMPLASIWGAAGDAGIVGPDSVGVFMSWQDGFASTDGSADTLQIASASGTVEFDLLVWWA